MSPIKEIKHKKTISKGGKPTNPLLVKGEVGRIRPTVYDLPTEDHVYGIAVIRDPLECAANVIHHWNVTEKGRDSVPTLDYISMNRNSAKLGVNTPKKIRNYRKEHPIRRKQGDQSNMYRAEGVGTGEYTRTKAALPSDKDIYFTYGKPTRPSTPVAFLMTDRYQKEWTIKQQQADEIAEKAAKDREMKKHIAHTPKMLVKKGPSQTKELFKMKKFQKKSIREKKIDGLIADATNHEPHDD